MRRFFQSLLHIRRLQGVNHFIEIAFHDAVEIVERQADAVIGDPVLRKIVGANFFFAPAGADLALARARNISLLLRAVFLRAVARAKYLALSPCSSAGCVRPGNARFFLSECASPAPRNRSCSRPGRPVRPRDKLQCADLPASIRDRLPRLRATRRRSRWMCECDPALPSRAHAARDARRFRSASLRKTDSPETLKIDFLQTAKFRWTRLEVFDL